MKKTTPAPNSAVAELDQDAELPEGWAEAELASLATLITKGTTPTTLGFQYQPKGISFVRVENLADGRIERSTITTFINKEADDALKRSRLQVGDLLFSIAGTIGRTALVAVEDLPANTNQALAIIRGTQSVIIPQLLQLVLASSVTQRQARSDARGGSMNNISLEDVRTMRLTIPPKAEQRRITPRLEELFVTLDKAEERLTTVPKILKAFRRSVLAAACSGRLTEDWREIKHKDIDGWQQAFLADVADSRLGKMLDQAKNVGTPTPYLRNVNVRWFAFDVDDLFSMRATKEDQREFNIKNGDLLVCEGGEPGRCAVWDLGPMDLIFQKAIHRVRLNGNISPFWLAFNLKHDADSGTLAEYFTGSGIKHLTGRSLATYTFQVPPPEEQNEIVRRVEALFKLADKIEQRVAAATKRSEKLMQSILAKAFRGELVPTEAELARKEGRDYEPAYALLERIRADREKAAASPNGSKRQVTTRKK
jgi:type I restriction enzyme S subunit